MYKETASDIATFLNVTPRAVTKWARHGYPVNINGESRSIPFEGSQLIGSRNWRFNLKQVKNFMERIDEQRWEYLNARTQIKTGKRKKQKIGRVSSISTMSDTAKQCRELAVSQRRKPKSSVMN